MSMRIVGFLAALWISAQAISQNVAWIATGGMNRNIRGFHLTPIGDINGDGYEDAMTIVDQTCPVQSIGTLAWILSGRDGTRIREVASMCGTCVFYDVGEVGDWNLDGVADYFVVQGNSQMGFGGVASGVDDTPIMSLPLSDVYASNLDLDGDGRVDAVTGASWANQGQGIVTAYGNAGQVLYQLFGDLSASANPPLSIGYSLAKLGDVDADGCDDFIMGALEPTYRGAVVIVSGRTGTRIRICYGGAPMDSVGLVVAACGDVDGDAYPDFIGATGTNFVVPQIVVRVFSGRTGLGLFQYSRPFGSNFSECTDSRGIDLDEDGVPDFVISEPYFYPGTNIVGAVWAYSGRTGSLLHGITGQPAQAGPSGWIGSDVTILRRPAGEKSGLILVPNPTTLQSQCSQGAIVAYNGLPRTSVIIGPGCPGALTHAPEIGMASQGTTGVRLHASSAPPNSLAVLLVGLSTSSWYGVPLPASLDPVGMPGCLLRTSIDLMCTSLTGAVSNDYGYAFKDLPLPVPATGNGAWTVSAQWWVLGVGSSFPGGVSEAITWRR